MKSIFIYITILFSLLLNGYAVAQTSSQNNCISGNNLRDSFIYTQPIGTYDLLSHGTTLAKCDSSKSLHLSDTQYPDNIINLPCVIPPNTQLTGAPSALSTTPNVHSMSTPMVADINGDSIPEIIVPRSGTLSSYWLSDGLLIFSGIDGSLIQTISTPQFYLHGQCISIADVDDDGNAEIFLLDREGYVMCYNSNGTQRWVNSSVVVGWNFLLSVADIMGNGNPQLVCGKYFFNASDGTLLLNGSMQNSGMGFGAPHGHSSQTLPYYMYALADIDSDSTLELCAGNSIYKINIINLSGTAGNSFSLLRQAANNPQIINPDGQTFVADFDGDGDLDICVIGMSHSVGSHTNLSAPTQTVNTYVWNAQTSDIIAHASLDNSSAQNKNFSPSLPSAADLDGDGLPEIIFSWSQVGLVRYSYNSSLPGNIRLLPLQPSLGLTSAPTPFDFNYDGHNEIVFHTDQSLLILDGSSLDTLFPPLPASCNTISQYPVIADVNADGQAEIILCQAYPPNSTSSSYWNGAVTVYGNNSSSPWSSARKVWNQWAYSSVNINEDLSLPQVQFNPASLFPNGTQPFNGFLHQMPYLNQNGDPINPAADATIIDASAIISGDLFSITLTISNLSSLPLNNPFGISTHINSYGGPILRIDTICTPLVQSDPQSATIQLPRDIICSLSNTDSLLFAINDLGSGIAQNGNQQPECDTTNNTIKIAIPHNSYSDTTAIVCDSLLWWNTNYTNSTNTATHTFINSQGCDSVVTLHLTVNHSNTGTDILTACDSLTWIDGNAYTTSVQNSTFTIQNSQGCDSVVTLNLTVNHSNTGDTSAVVCDSLLWWNTKYTNSTNAATHTYTNAAGCDSVVTLNLTVNYSNTGDTTAVVCDSLLWWNTNYTNSTNTATHTYTNAAGCDSVVTLNLTVNYSNTGDTTAVVCDSLLWWNTNYTNSTNAATHTYTNAAGCDSTVTLHLTVNYSNTGDTTAVVCDSLLWWNTNYTNSTNAATHTYTNAAGCDSTVTLHLTVNHSSSGTDILTACDSLTWIDSNTYTASVQNPTFTIQNSQGCDSVVTLHLTVNHSTSSDTTVYACDGFIWHDTEYSQSDTISFVSANTAGCDSTETLYLHIGHTSFGDTAATACDSLLWWNTNYTNSTNTATHIYSNHYGCDSIVTLHLSIIHSKMAELTDSFCAGTIYLFDTLELAAGGIYYNSYQAANGCDSTTRLTLTMLTPPLVDIGLEFDCNSREQQLRALTTVDYVQWSTTDGWNPLWGSANNRTVYMTIDQPTTVTLLADYNNSSLCPNSKSIALTPVVKPKAKMDVTPDFLTTDNNRIVARSLSSNYDWLQWSIDGNDAGNNISIDFGSQNNADSVVIALVAANRKCADTTERTIYVKRTAIFAPNAFTPDEATNRNFEIITDGIVEYVLYIYNRQGLLVFSSSPNRTQWDGSLNGHPCPQGSYVWTVRYRSVIDPGNWHSEKGTVTLMR